MPTNFAKNLGTGSQEGGGIPTTPQRQTQSKKLTTFIE